MCCKAPITLNWTVIDGHCYTTCAQVLKMLSMNATYMKQKHSLLEVEGTVMAHVMWYFTSPQTQKLYEWNCNHGSWVQLFRSFSNQHWVVDGGLNAAKTTVYSEFTLFRYSIPAGFTLRPCWCHEDLNEGFLINSSWKFSVIWEHNTTASKGSQFDTQIILKQASSGTGPARTCSPWQSSDTYQSLFSYNFLIY